MKTIKSKREFEKVFHDGRRYSHALLRVTVLNGDVTAQGRVAFVAARRLGNAVFRNRCKRVLREAARTCGLPADGSDIILFATRATHDAHMVDVCRALSSLLTKARVA